MRIVFAIVLLGKLLFISKNKYPCHSGSIYSVSWGSFAIFRGNVKIDASGMTTWAILCSSTACLTWVRSKKTRVRFVQKHILFPLKGDFKKSKHNYCILLFTSNSGYFIRTTGKMYQLHGKCVFNICKISNSSVRTQSRANGNSSTTGSKSSWFDGAHHEDNFLPPRKILNQPQVLHVIFSEWNDRTLQCKI